MFFVGVVRLQARSWYARAVVLCDDVMVQPAQYADYST